jgi:TorA maturation chaperone TorD
LAGLPLASRLWLREPDAETIARAHEDLGLPPAEPSELALAFTDLFVLNVFPYGSVFLDPTGELNGPSTETLSELFAKTDLDPTELREVAAPDHLGLCLAYLEERRHDASDDYEWSWMHACCIAVQREPGVHPFYRELAGRTMSVIPSTLDPRPSTLESPLTLRDDKDEVTLGRIVRFFLAPARCGMFLSRGRLGHIARNLDTRLPFGSRFEVARSLFQADRLNALLEALRKEADEWAEALPEQSTWRERLEDTRATLDQMAALALDSCRKTY